MFLDFVFFTTYALTAWFWPNAHKNNVSQILGLF